MRLRKSASASGLRSATESHQMKWCDSMKEAGVVIVYQSDTAFCVENALIRWQAYFHGHFYFASMSGRSICSMRGIIAAIYLPMLHSINTAIWMKEAIPVTEYVVSIAIAGRRLRGHQIIIRNWWRWRPLIREATRYIENVDYVRLTPRHIIR